MNAGAPRRTLQATLDGNCGVGSFSASAEGVDLAFTDTNWIHYEFAWSN